MGLREAVKEEMSWSKTWNGADAKNTSGSALVDFVGRSGAIRGLEAENKWILFVKAFKEDNTNALRLLFYTRDIRGGYGERDTFNQIFREFADRHPESAEKNLWAVLEFGRAKDLYSLVGTSAEDAMWRFMKNQFELDVENMKAEKSISLLAKWIASPRWGSKEQAKLGRKTADKLGYKNRYTEYRHILTSLRAYLDIPEAKMCSGRWDEIEYSKCSSVFLLKNRKAFAKHDKERWEAFNTKVQSGEEKMNMGAVTPADIIYQVRSNYTKDLETMWMSLPDVCEGNVMVMCDTSGSMNCYDYYVANKVKTNVKPIDVAFGLAMYFAQHNKGDLKDLMMNFSHEPMFIELCGETLKDNFRIAEGAPVNYSSTNLEGAFDLLLNTCVGAKLPQEDMPQAILIVSDMQINCVRGLDENKRMLFYDKMAEKYKMAGYSMPQVIFWNVNAVNATFHATMDTAGVSLVSGYSTNVFKQVMDNIGTTPYDLMMSIVNDERYSKIEY